MKTSEEGAVSRQRLNQGQGMGQTCHKKQEAFSGSCIC